MKAGNAVAQAKPSWLAKMRQKPVVVPIANEADTLCALEARKTALATKIDASEANVRTLQRQMWQQRQRGDRSEAARRTVHELNAAQQATLTMRQQWDDVVAQIEDAKSLL